MPITGLSDIPSNFTISSNISIQAGATAECLPNTGEGKLRFRCNTSHVSYDDPILYPGQPGAAHLHHFFGNSGARYDSTYASLRAGTSLAGTPNTTGSDSTCSGKGLNRTGYWFPAMIKPAGFGFPVPKVVQPEFIELYYNMEPWMLDDYTPATGAYSHKTNGMRPFPNGLQMIWGWEHTMPMRPGPALWGVPTHPAYIAAGGAFQNTLQGVLDYAPGILTPPYHSLQARFDSPTCWDGDNLRAATTTPSIAGGVNQPSGYGPGRSHIARHFQDGNGRLICPATHSYRIPQVTFICAWPASDPNDWKNWYLSVDRHNGMNMAGGTGFHTDWYGAWDSDIQTMWETNHMQIGFSSATANEKTSNSGNLCQEDKTMVNSHLVLNPAGTYLDIPAPPGKKRLRLNLSV
jgi:hypothetical protein